ncbi:hypothetical protein GF314_10605 [bacterium]|nr:hypothetical protein [bacterium]
MTATPPTTPDPPRWTTLSWLAAGAVFALSGVLKLINPAGTMPEVLAPLTELASRAAWMRLVGAGEVLVAGLIAWPRTRRRGLVVLTAITIAFSLLIAWSAADRSFLGDCGCFGGWGGATSYHGWLVLRNGVVVLVAVLAVAGLAGRSARAAARLALVIAAFAVLVPGLVGEMRLRQASYDELAASTTARRLMGGHGLPLPSLALRDADGRPVPTGRALGAGDLIAFLSRSCPHCLALGPSLHDRHVALQADDRRVVIVQVGADRIDREWLARLRCADLPAFATRDRLALARLGVREVPHLVQLGPDGHIAFNPTTPVPPSLWRSLPLIASRREGLDTLVWHEITVAIFGEDARLGRPLALDRDAATAPVVGPGGARLGILGVVQDGWRPADIVELAVGLDPAGVITGVVPLSAGAHARVFTPELALVDSLAGRDLAAADAWLAERARRPSLAQPVWQSVRRALGRLERPD